MATDWSQFEPIDEQNKSVASSPKTTDWSQFTPVSEEKPSLIDKAKNILPEGIRKSIESGYEQSATGLAARLAKGEKGLPESYQPQTFLEKAAQGASQMVSELPQMWAGGQAGAALGIAGGPLAEFTVPVGAAAGAFAAPTAMREALRQKLETGQVSDYGSIAKETAKTALIGALTGGAGKLAKIALPEASLASKIGVPAAEIATMTGAGAATEGRMPTAEELALNTIPIAGLHAVGAAGGRLLRGKTPSIADMGRGEEVPLEGRNIGPVMPEYQGAPLPQNPEGIQGPPLPVNPQEIQGPSIEHGQYQPLPRRGINLLEPKGQSFPEYTGGILPQEEARLRAASGIAGELPLSNEDFIAQQEQARLSNIEEGQPLHKRLANAVDNPREADILDNMRIAGQPLPDEIKTKMVIQDAMDNPLRAAEMDLNNGDTQKAKDEIAQVKDNADKLKVADGPLTEAEVKIREEKAKEIEDKIKTQEGETPTQQPAKAEGLMTPPVVSELLDTAKKSQAELRKEISNVRYGTPGEILFDFRNKTYSAPEPKDVMPVGQGEASQSWALRQILDKNVKEVGLVAPTQEPVSAETKFSPETKPSILPEGMKVNRNIDSFSKYLKDNNITSINAKDIPYKNITNYKSGELSKARVAEELGKRGITVETGRRKGGKVSLQVGPVYHGSPYKFTKFADEKIGTGEGAQAFGYGHYLTESPEVAGTYFRSNKRGYAPQVTFKGKDIYHSADELGLKNTYFDKDISTIEQTAYNSKNIDDMLETFKEALSNSKIPELKAQYGRIVNAIEKNKKDLAIEGDNLYTATINKGKPSSADVFLEWDKPLSQQPKQVQDLVNNLPADTQALIKRNGEDGSAIYRVLHESIGGQYSNPNIQNQLMDLANSGKVRMEGTAEELASGFLNNQGITGIKYPTGTLSGIKGSDKYNYVVFDPKNITIEAINGKPLPKDVENLAKDKMLNNPISADEAVKEAQDEIRLQAERKGTEPLTPEAINKDLDLFEQRMGIRIPTTQEAELSAAVKAVAAKLGKAESDIMASFTSDKNIGKIALYATADKTSLPHELAHASMEIFRRAADNGNKEAERIVKVLEKKYPNEEKFADAMSRAWVEFNGGEKATGISTRVMTAFRKLFEVFQRINNYIQGRGFQTYKDIQQGILEGKYKGMAESALGGKTEGKTVLTQPQVGESYDEWKKGLNTGIVEPPKATGTEKSWAEMTPEEQMQESKKYMDESGKLAFQTKQEKALQEVKETGRGLSDFFKSLIAPTTKSKGHLDAAEVVSSAHGSANRRASIAVEKLKPFDTMLTKMGVYNTDIPITDSFEAKFGSDMSQGRFDKMTNDEVKNRYSVNIAKAINIKKAAQVSESLFKNRLEKLSEVGAGLESARENYFPGMHTKESIRAFNQAIGEYAESHGLDMENENILNWSAEIKAEIANRVQELINEGKGSDRDALQYLSKRPLDPNSFRKQKVFDDIMTAREFGLMPISRNPLDLVKLKLAEIDKSIATHQAMNEFKAKGDEKFLRLGERMPEGFAKIDDRYGTVMTPTGQIAGYRIFKTPVAEIINNYTSKDLYSNPLIGKAFKGYMAIANGLNQFQLGMFSAFHAGFTSAEVTISATANAMKDAYGVLRGNRSVTDLGKSLAYIPQAMFRTPATGKGILSEFANPSIEINTAMPVKDITNRPALIAKAVELAGGGFKIERGLRTDSLNKFKQDYYSGKTLDAIKHSPFAFTEWTAKPIMDILVPRQKAGVFGELVGRLVEQNPNKSLEELRPELRQAWNRVDSRLGQVQYNRLFIRNAVKNTIQALVRAPGWSGGTITEVGGSFKDAGKFMSDWIKTGKAPSEIPDRVAYTLSLMLTTAIINGLMTKGISGDDPKGMDFIAFRTGGLDEHGNPERFLIPTYAKDMYAYYNKPGQTLLNKTHPMISLLSDMIQNKDYYGVEIRHKTDNPVAQAADIGKYALKAFVPFWMRGTQKAYERDDSLTAMVAPLIGIMPASAEFTKTPAQKLMSEIQLERPQKPITPEQKETHDIMHKIENKIRKGDMTAKDDIATAISEGKLSKNNVRSIYADARLSTTQIGFKKLSVEDALRVYEAANEMEKPQLQRLLAQKVRSALRNRTPEERIAIIAKYRELVGRTT